MRRGWNGVCHALASWASELLRPLAGDEAGRRFWVRHVRVGVALTETSALVVAGYVVLADRPHRTLLLVIAALVMATSPGLLYLPMQRLSSGVRGPLIFYLWSVAVTIVVAAVALLDGGADSPLLWLLVLTMTFAALAYPPPGVLLMGALMVAAYLAVVVVDSSLGPGSLLVATVLLSFTVMTAWVSRNHWDTYDQQRLLAVRLAELDRTREEFLATTSHELRTPVASILGYLELLEDALAATEANRVGFLARIRRNAERLRDLSEDLLVLSHWEQEQRARNDGEQQPGEADLVEVVGRVHETMAPLASRQQVSLVVEVPSEPLGVTGSADRLERAVLNLVSNAVKYTPAGGNVSCHLGRASDDAVIEVRDDGIGIAEDEVERLFGRFFRASSARERSIAGVGLGLSIVHEIVASLGGSIDVSSRLGGGTAFVVRVPCSPPAEVRGSAEHRTLVPGESCELAHREPHTPSAPA